MLVLNRKLNEAVRLSFGALFIDVSVLVITKTHIRLGFDGPREIQIDRVETLTEEELKETECRK